MDRPLSNFFITQEFICFICVADKKIEWLKEKTPGARRKILQISNEKEKERS